MLQLLGSPVMHAFSHHMSWLGHTSMGHNDVSNTVKSVTANLHQRENRPDVTCLMLCTLSMPPSALLGGRQALTHSIPAQGLVLV